MRILPLLNWNTVPSAEQTMNKGQKMEDNSLKQLQYQASAIIRPLDVLAHEMITQDSNNANLERFCTILADMRSLVVDLCSTITQSRTNIAYRAVNPSFTVKAEPDVGYTVPPEEFQQGISQQAAAKKAIREASHLRRPRRRFPNGNFIFSARSTLSAGWFQQHLQQSQQQLSGQQQQQEEHQPLSSVTTPTLSTSTTDPVGGRLSKYYSNWTKTSINSFVDNTIQQDYKIQFHTKPPTTTSPTAIHTLSQDQVPLIDQTIQDLLHKQAIELVSPEEAQRTPGFYSSMFVIPKKDGGIRPVFNLKRLNQYLHAPHFKMDTSREVSLMIHRNDYLVSIDLSDAFLHIGLHSESRRFLRLKWQGKVYQYRTIASSPYVFTKVCRPILEYLRSQGIRISAYLDDWLLVAENKELALQQSQMVVSLLQQLGWLVNFKKSVLTPTQNLEHLGFVLNTKKMTAALPLKKLRDIRRSIRASGHICGISSTPIYSPPPILQEPDSQDRCRLGHSSSPGFSESTGTIMVVPQLQEVERPLDPTNDPDANHFCGREQHRLGLQLEPTSSPWLLDPIRSGTINQLAGTQGCFSGAPDVSPPRALHSPHSNGQHYQSVLYQQARRDSLSGVIGPSNRSLKLVFTAQDSDPSTTHQRSKEHGSRYGISTDILQESVDDQALNLPTHITPLGTLLSRPVRRQDNQAVAKVRVVASGSGRYPYGCVYHPVDDVSAALHQSTMEPHHESTPQNHTGTASSGDPSGSLLAECPMVSSSSTYGSFSSLDASSTGSTDDVSQDTSPITTAELDALHVATLRQQLLKRNLNAQATEDLLAQKLAPTGTNLSYRKNQLRFLEWAIQNNVSFTSFTPVELVNFLADMGRRHSLQASTLKTLRAAVGHLHDDPKGIRESDVINNYIDSKMKQAPPVNIHRPTIDVSPAITFARSIASRSTTSLKLLQQKLVFLLAMSAFLRPSDLARIAFDSCSITDTGCLSFHVVAPKETRGKRRIIKPFTVHPHASDIELCPVQCFKALRDHPGLASRPSGSQLFVKSNLINQPLSSSTISTWLHSEFIQLCTSEPNVSIRSLALSRALDLGISKDHIVTLGNWASSSTFENHYQRNQMAQVDFTSTVLSEPLDQFFDAPDDFSLD